ncbi:eukaryotic translation initiation factor 2D isoform X2 [Chanos chanos]|uniref:Eukaryotic translation initiation factor 2D n=1 Tax=Chanos chanos TaxID=29144 RepID=A0A6J2W563_CHACN|nr:eukaryotic translation initiation factor 2D isoform X2 [Chanos chanos]
MFAKAFRVKSNTVIKGSDRRKLKADISAAFPCLSPEELSELVPNKEDLNVVKIYAHKGDAVTLYVLNKNPMFFQVEKQLYPTVYTLWRYPDMLPAFTTWPPVLQKLVGGADLMLPGVVVSPGGLADVKQGDFCAVNVVNNRVPVAVGTAAMSSTEMQNCGMKGKGVNVLHTYMDQLCPRGKQLDIKKSSYKKLSKFLQVMQKEHSLVQVKELSKGVESIVEVDWKNPELRSFSTPEDCGPAEDSVEGTGASEVPYHPPEITPLYSVTARLETLFQDAQKRKGAVLQASDIRAIITDYVKKNELVDDTNKNYVNINPTLCDCLLEKSEYQEVEKLKWDDLFSRTLSRMQACHQLLFPGQAPVIRKGTVEPIDITVASRGSNKKVTIIKNLEVFGLDPAVVATTLQQRVQASCVLHAAPGAKDRLLVQVQGNQVQQVGKLLLDQYQIPRKYIQGLEKAAKPGKKK